MRGAHGMKLLSREALFLDGGQALGCWIEFSFETLGDSWTKMKPLLTAVVFCLVASSLRHCAGELLSQRRSGRSGLNRIYFRLVRLACRWNGFMLPWSRRRNERR